ITLVGQAWIRAFGVLASPESFEASPRLQMAREGLVQTAGARRSDVDDVAANLADHVDARLAFERAQPLRVRLAPPPAPAIRKARVARGERVRIRDRFPTTHDDRRIHAVVRSPEPELEVQVLQVLGIEWRRTDRSDGLTGAHVVAFLHE